MLIREILKKGNEILIKNNIEENFLKTRILLSDVLNVEKEYLIIHDEEEVLREKETEFFKKIERLSKGEPLQYITNKAEFMNLEFYVDENVLIPQPDTEILVQNVISLAKSKTKVKILDLCTGSGAIGISLYNNLENAEIFASDISKKALEVAKKNAKTHNSKIEFILSNLFDNINLKFDIIVSNPPYIETTELEKLPLEVKNEPKLALDGGEDGLYFYKNIIKLAPQFLNKDGYLAVEIGYNQKEKVENIFKDSGFKNISIKKDLSNIDRIIYGQF